VLKRAGFLLLASVAAALLAVWFYNGRANEKAVPTPKASETSKFIRATFTPAARRVANEFIAKAVARRDPAAWRLLDPDYPCVEGKAKKAWQSGQVPIVPLGPFRMKDVSLSVGHRFPKSIYLDVVIRRDWGRPAYLSMGLNRHGRDRWLVRWWDIVHGPQSAFFCS
jgi:hypothetical protein